MPKRGTFLLVVQTALLANATSVASQPEKAGQYHHEVSALGVLELMSKAVAVSEIIPETMSAAQAANEFCHYMLDHLKDARQERDGVQAEPPQWFAHLDWSAGSDDVRTSLSEDGHRGITRRTKE